MKRLYAYSKKYLLPLVLCGLLFACSKVSQHNFDKIKPNMTMGEVTAILGTPTNSESVNVGGISGTSAVWKEKDIQISIQFLNDKVAVKSFSKDNDSKSAETSN